MVSSKPEEAALKSSLAFDRPSDAGQRGDGDKVSAAHKEAAAERWILKWFQREWSQRRRAFLTEAALNHVGGRRTQLGCTSDICWAFSGHLHECDSKVTLGALVSTRRLSQISSCQHSGDD